jgi:hypothetical protein
MTFAPTPEQQNAVDLFLTGKDLVIEAGAGTGKTSTLVHIAKANPEKRMQYVAFNSAIVRESKAKMPENVSCNTMHSLAMREEGKKYRHRLDSGRMKSMQIARHLDVDDIQITVDGTAKKRLSAGYLASHVMRAIQSFCQSADPVPTRSHFPYIEGIDLPAADGRRRNVGRRDRNREKQKSGKERSQDGGEESQSGQSRDPGQDVEENQTRIGKASIASGRRRIRRDGGIPRWKIPLQEGIACGMRRRSTSHLDDESRR